MFFWRGRKEAGHITGIFSPPKIPGDFWVDWSEIGRGYMHWKTSAPNFCAADTGDVFRHKKKGGKNINCVMGTPWFQSQLDLVFLRWAVSQGKWLKHSVFQFIHLSSSDNMPSLSGVLGKWDTAPRVCHPTESVVRRAVHSR